jgi:squalene cyclase
MQTYGSQVWDASFAIQALLATNLSDEIGPTLMKGHDFLKKSQVFLIYIHQLKVIVTQAFFICINVTYVSSGSLYMGLDLFH